MSRRSVRLCGWAGRVPVAARGAGDEDSGKSGEGLAREAGTDDDVTSPVGEALRLAERSGFLVALGAGGTGPPAGRESHGSSRGARRLAWNNRLVLQTGLHLRFAQDDHGGRLQVQAHATRDDLADQHARLSRRGEGIDQALPLVWGGGTRDSAYHASTKPLVHPLQDLPVEGKDQDLAVVTRCFVHQLLEAFELLGSIRVCGRAILRIAWKSRSTTASK